MLCRKPGCAFRHPDLCANPACIPTRAPGCAKFHGRFKEDKEDTAHKTNTVRTKKDNNPAKKSSQRPAQGHGRRGGPPQNRNSSGRSNSRRFPPSSAPPLGGAPGRSTSERELQELKKELASLRNLSLGPRPPHMGNNYSYSDAVKSSVPAPPLNSFAVVFAAALEKALSNAGLQLAASS